MENNININNSEIVNKKEVHLFYCSETEDLARNIAAISDSIHLNPINWRYVCIYIYIYAYFL
jgi:hypothetical protein